MRYIGCFYIFFLMLVACSSDGNSSVPDIPDDPDGTKVFMLSRGGADVFVDDTGNGLELDDDGRLQGDNVFFTSSKKCDGLSYVTSIPMSDWSVGSGVLGKGDGLVMGSKMFDGATFTRLFVEKVDTASGDVTLKSQSPFYGGTDDFYLNHKRLLLFKDAGDTAVVLIKPTTYNVELASGQWVKVNPHITYVMLSFLENNTGGMRADTLIFSNGVLPEKRIPIVQLEYSLSDSDENNKNTAVN